MRHLDASRSGRHASSIQPVGVRVLLRDSATLDDLGLVHAPPPVEPGDLVSVTA